VCWSASQAGESWVVVVDGVEISLRRRVELKSVRGSLGAPVVIRKG
jgi:hypothetical protein